MRFTRKNGKDNEYVLDDAVGFDSPLDSFRPICQKGSDYYLLERYPRPGRLPDAQDIEAILPQAEVSPRKLGMTLR